MSVTSQRLFIAASVSLLFPRFSSRKQEGFKLRAEARAAQPSSVTPLCLSLYTEEFREGSHFKNFHTNGEKTFINACTLYLSVCNLQLKSLITFESAFRPQSPTGFSLRSSSLSVIGFAVRAEAKAVAPPSVMSQNANLQKEFFT